MSVSSKRLFREAATRVYRCSRFSPSRDVVARSWLCAALGFSFLLRYSASKIAHHVKIFNNLFVLSSCISLVAPLPGWPLGQGSSLSRAPPPATPTGGGRSHRPDGTGSGSPGECLSGIRRYGPGLRGIELIHKTGRTRRQRKTRQRSVPEEDSLLTPHRAGTNVIAPAFMQ